MKEKNIVITGAGSGLGKEAAIFLAKRGHKVYATTQFENQTKSLNDIAKSDNLNLHSFKLDILKESDREKLKNVEFDCLINNAAIGDSGSVAEVDIDRIKEVFDTNVFANIKVTQIAVEKFIKQKYGRVIFISSLVGRIPFPFLAPYCASKSAIEGFATSLKNELKMLDGSNVQVGIIEPGAYKTGFNMKNINKKYNWMQYDSFFRYKWEDMYQKEHKIWNIIEKKNFNSIINQYVKAVEDKNVKLRYTAPKSQAFLTEIGMILGM